MTIPPPANPYADRAGLARLHSGHWFVYERVLASYEPGSMIHASLENMPRTACNRKVTFRYGVSPTDTISMIECAQCRAYLETKTL